jgi:hypothetical protein
MQAFDVTAECDRYFEDTSVPSTGDPVAVIFMGGVGAGKTTLRKQQYSKGYVLIDAADIFITLSRGNICLSRVPLRSRWQRLVDVLRIGP